MNIVSVWGQISPNKKILFLPIPKVACTSAEMLLINNGWSKRLGKRIVDLDKVDFIFAFVRNPWDRLVSRYAHLRRNLVALNSGREIGAGELKNLKGFSKFINKKGDLDLEDFTFKKFASFTLKVSDHHWDSQVSLLTKSIGELDKINFIGRFENLEQDWKSVSHKINISLGSFMDPNSTAQHVNKSPHKHYTEYYDDETREIIAKKYAADIEQWGYEFGK